VVTPSDTATSALGDVDRLRGVLRKKRTPQVASRDECDLVKATALTWFNTHRQSFDAATTEASAADDLYRKLLTAGDRQTSRKVYFALLKDLRELLIALKSAVVTLAAPAPSTDAPPDFRALANPDMKSVLVERWNECARCVSAPAPMAATVMMGGLLETLLLARINLEANKAPVFTATTAPRDRGGKTLLLNEWSLKDYIFRNYIHPHKQLSHGVHLRDDDAALFWDVCKTITRQLLKNCP